MHPHATFRAFYKNAFILVAIMTPKKELYLYSFLYRSILYRSQNVGNRYHYLVDKEQGVQWLQNLAMLQRLMDCVLSQS